MEDYTEEQKEDFLKNTYLPPIKKKIESKKEELNQLEKLAKILDNRDSEIIKKNKENSCYNKANLSEQSEENEDSQRIYKHIEQLKNPSKELKKFINDVKNQ